MPGSVFRASRIMHIDPPIPASILHVRHLMKSFVLTVRLLTGKTF